jgi:hypothetical protein
MYLAIFKTPRLQNVSHPLHKILLGLREHIFDSTQAPVAVAVHEIGLHKQIK